MIDKIKNLELKLQQYEPKEELDYEEELQKEQNIIDDKDYANIVTDLIFEWS